jgi:hypothetical protein
MAKSQLLRAMCEGVAAERMVISIVNNCVLLEIPCVKHARGYSCANV